MRAKKQSPPNGVAALKQKVYSETGLEKKAIPGFMWEKSLNKMKSGDCWQEVKFSAEEENARAVV